MDQQRKSGYMRRLMQFNENHREVKRSFFNATVYTQYS